MSCGFKNGKKKVMSKEKLVQEAGVISSDVSEITRQGYHYPKEKIGCIVCEAQVTSNEQGEINTRSHIRSSDINESARQDHHLWNWLRNFLST